MLSFFLTKSQSQRSFEQQSHLESYFFSPFVNFLPLSLSTKMNSTEFAQKFTTDGYGIIENFLDPATICEMKREMSRLVEQFTLDSTAGPSVFIAGTEQTTDSYFLHSGDQIRYFLEKDVIDESGSLTVPKERCLNKIGHALHWWSAPFKKVTFGSAFKDLARSLGLVDPLVVQSMIIFKNPQIGGEVVEHQDASYLHTLPGPKGAVVGFWIPLEDATVRWRERERDNFSAKL